MTTLRTRDTRSRLDIPTGECKVCAKPFIKLNSMQSVCSVYCAKRVPIIARNTLKAEAKKDRQRREALKTLSDWNKDAQSEFNRYIRLRDAGKPCICCSRFSSPGAGSSGGVFDAGHFRSRGAAGHLRFDERNCHAQLKQCNRYAFDVAAYRAGLVAKIGLAEVEALEADNTPRKYTIDDLKAIRDKYRALSRQLEKERESM